MKIWNIIAFIKISFPNLNDKLSSLLFYLYLYNSPKIFQYPSIIKHMSTNPRTNMATFYANSKSKKPIKSFVCALKKLYKNSVLTTMLYAPLSTKSNSYRNRKIKMELLRDFLSNSLAVSLSVIAVGYSTFVESLNDCDCEVTTTQLLTRHVYENHRC